MKKQYKNLSDEEKGAFWDILVSASADIPEIFKDITEFGGKASALIGTGVAAIQFFRKKYEYKKFYQRFESIGCGLIPVGVSKEDTNQIFRIVIDYLKKLRHSDHKLSYYFLNKEKAPELVEQLFQTCIQSDRDMRITNDDLRISLNNLSFVLLQNNSDDVMLLTETADVVRDILRRLEQIGIDISSIMDRLTTLEGIVNHLPPDYRTYINNAVLPSVISSNIFSFRNTAISYQNPTNLYKLSEWLNQSSTSVWAVTGPGGSGKSRLALELAKMAERTASCKPVWLDKQLLKSLLECPDYNYSKPVLFICDYASQFEDQLVSLIDRISCHDVKAKFLLLDRTDTWYYTFRKRYSIIETLSLEQPIDLSNTTFSDDAYSQIIKELSATEYNGQTISSQAEQQIIEKAKELSGGKDSVRFLFFMLVADSYFRGSDIRNLNSEALLNNYIFHSRSIILKSLGWEPYMDEKQKHDIEELVDRGFRILAYATACDGIHWEDSHPPIQDDLNRIMQYFPDDRHSINLFFTRFSEEEEENTVSAFKPDLIGELLFLDIWKNLFASNRQKWFAEMVNFNHCFTFLARCLIDWDTESKTLLTFITDKTASINQRVHFANVFKEAVHETQSTNKQVEFTRNIKALNCDYSISILKVLTSAIQCIFDHSVKEIRAECVKSIKTIEWEKYQCITTDDYRLMSATLCDIATLFEDIADYNTASEYYEKALNICEEQFGLDNLDTAEVYNFIAGVYRLQKKYEEALDYYNRAKKIYESQCVQSTPEIASIYNNIAVVYDDKHEYQTALLYYKHALEICEEKLGKSHYETAITYNNIANIYKSINNPVQALVFYQKALAIFVKVFGHEHVHTATVYNNMAGAHQDNHEYNLALTYYQKAHDIRTRILGNNHPHTIQTLNHLNKLKLLLSK